MSYTVAYLWQIHYNSHNETLEIFIVGYDVKEHISQDFLFVLILKYFFFFFFPPGLLSLSSSITS